MSDGNVDPAGPSQAAGPILYGLNPQLVAQLGDLYRATAAPVPLHYASSSAFRAVGEPAASRDVADASAAAQQVDALVPAMFEQLAGSFRSALAAFRAGPSAAADPLAWVTLPATAAALEAVESGLRALDDGLPAEAATLFDRAVDSAPSDPFARLGAALAAHRLGLHLGAAGHLARASLFLVDDDPAGACYTAILAAGLHHRHGSPTDAVAVLTALQDRLSPPCAALALHLAFLEMGPLAAQTRMVTALALDPLTQADLAAMTLTPDPATVAERRAVIDNTIAALELSLATLGTTPAPRPDAPHGLDLVEAELTLANRVSACRQGLARQEAEVASLAANRRAWHDQWESLEEQSAAALDHEVVFVPVMINLAVAVLIPVVALIGRLAARAVPLLQVPVTVAVVVIVVGLALGAIWRSLAVVIERPDFVRAGWARSQLPVVRAQLANAMAIEFARRRVFREARRQVEPRLAALAGSLPGLVPRCPRFAPPDQVPVPGRTWRLVGPETTGPEMGSE